MLKEGLPRYEAVKAYICERIDNGVWKPGEKIPSETILAEKLGVSRMTANRAIRELSNESRLHRVTGVGTFVLAPKVRGTILEIRSISEEIKARGHTHRSKLLQLVREVAQSNVARLLELPEGAEIFHAVIVHFENEEPVQLEKRFVNPVAAPGFMDIDFSRRTPSDYLLSALPVTEIEQTIEARLPNVGEADVLDMDVAEPCLVLERTSRAGKLVVTYVQLIHPGKHVTLGGRTLFGQSRSER